MAINVKKLKRVIQGNEPLKVLNSGDKKPAFRQNGYGLTFDATNSDYLSFTNPTQIDLLSEVSFSVTASYPTLITAQRIIAIGVPSMGVGYIELWLLDTGLIVFEVKDVNNVQVISVNGGIQAGLDVETTFSFDGVKVYRDNVEIIDVSSFGAVSLDIDTTEIATINRRTYLSSGYGNINLNEVTYLGETFNLTESRGTTTTGSLGTTATINTANAGGVQYLDSTVWNKKSFALIGEPLDDEKVTILGVEYPLSATPITEIEHLGEMFSLKEGLGNQVYGDGGTIGIISTDNVLGIERINFGMWLKGDDTNGWNPYT